MKDLVRAGIYCIAFGAVTASYALYSPEGEPQGLRAFIGCLCAATSGFWLLECIRAIIREELERKDSTP